MIRYINLFSLPLLCIVCAISPTSAQKSSYTFLSYVEGIRSPEDIVVIPGSKWVLVSSMVSDPDLSGAIYAIHTGDKRIIPVFSLAGNANVCDGLTRFAPHGIFLHRSGDKHNYLFVVNHGSREAIERFEVTLQNDLPVLNWIDHADLPPGVWANGIAGNSRDNIYVTGMFDPRDSHFVEKLERQQKTGQVWQLTSAGWRPFGDQTFSGANGIALSPDGAWMYVSEWAARRVWRMSIEKPSVATSVSVDFLPDNLRWSADGTLLVTGQRSSPKHLFGCKTISADCMYYTTIKINATSLEHETLIDDGRPEFGGGTVSIELTNELWVGTVLSDRIAIFKKH